MVNLAIVGGGIGGCSAAYFARKYIPGTNVTIYEAQDRLGGRILTQYADGATLELGAAFFNRFNKTLLDIANTEQLKIMPPEEPLDFAVWNGSKIIFRSNRQTSATILRLLAKYKLSLTRTYLLLRKVRGQIAKLYQEELKKQYDIRKIFETICLDEWYKKPFCEGLIEKGISEAFIDEIVAPITRAIYSQNVELSGFAGISSLIGVYSGSRYSLADGNSILPIHLAKVSNAKIKLSQKIDTVEKTPKGTYRLYSGTSMEVFDKVIIATPLEFADIKFEGISIHSWKPQPYQTVHKKVMKGFLDPDYFGFKDSSDPPANILTTKDAHPITDYSIKKANDGESLVMASSPEPIKENVFDGVFKKSKVSILEHCWKAAYPVFKPLANLPSARFDERVTYINALEPAISSMETSALSALSATRML